MMKAYSFVDEKIHEIARTEINKMYPSEKAEEILKRMESMHLDPEEMDFDDLSELFQADEDISNLPELGRVVSFLRKMDDLDFTVEDFNQLSGLLEQNPKNELYRLIWIVYKTNMFQNEEHFFKQVADFLDDVFSQQGTLINLIDDFISATDIDTLLFGALWQPETYELLLPVMEKAVQQYPGKIILKYILGRMYLENDNIQAGVAALQEVREYCNARWSWFDDGKFDAYDFYTYLDMIQALAVAYDKTGGDGMVSDYVNYILENLPTIYGPDDEEGIVDVFSYMDAHLLRMRLDMKAGERSKVLENFKKVEEHLEWEAYRINYKDVISYVEEEK